MRYSFAKRVFNARKRRIIRRQAGLTLAKPLRSCCTHCDTLDNRPLEPRFVVRILGFAAEAEMADTSRDRWYSVDEIAEYLGIKRFTVYKWIDRKNMPAHKVGSLWKFRKEEIDEWIRSGEARDRRTEHADDN
jgi:excisionase family DNA binding protein